MLFAKPRCSNCVFRNLFYKLCYLTEWMGADAAYSTKISYRKNFWSFGDSFCGKTALARQGFTWYEHSKRSITAGGDVIGVC
jgi:hypothetical protein